MAKLLVNTAVGSYHPQSVSAEITAATAAAAAIEARMAFWSAFKMKFKVEASCYKHMNSVIGLIRARVTPETQPQQQPHIAGIYIHPGVKVGIGVAGVNCLWGRCFCHYVNHCAW